MCKGRIEVSWKEGKQQLEIFMLEIKMLIGQFLFQSSGSQSVVNGPLGISEAILGSSRSKVLFNTETLFVLASVYKSNDLNCWYLSMDQSTDTDLY